MINLLGYIVLLPLLGFITLAIVGKRLSKNTIASIGVGSVGIAAILTIVLGIDYINHPTIDGTVAFWSWFKVDTLSPSISFTLDALSLIFIFVITFVGFLIHLYSASFMREDKSFARFFAYMNLFISAMLILVLADNLVLLYLGWEGVGLCSFLLIGFWYKNRDNANAAKKAFIVTRVGDTAMAIGLFLLFSQFNTLNIQEILKSIPTHWNIGDPMATWGAALLLGGAVGKSAQLPLQTWLPDAMAGPSPVSALIHAATMVTSGVYLIARTHVLFSHAPSIMMATAIIGALTLLIAGFSAMAQKDIKKVLAYSTISQIGYMFLALGVGAWSAGIFHFMTHAFFKALLFLGAGAVIMYMHHEHNMFKMGGLRKKIPVTFWTFLIASASLAALPLITAGFYSKDAILWYTWSSDRGGTVLWLAGIMGALVTSVYTFRMIFITFYGETKSKEGHKPGILIKIPLVVLAALSLLAGFIELPHNFGHVTVFSDWVNRSLPAIHVEQANPMAELLLQGISAILALLGVYIAYLYFIKKPTLAQNTDSQFAALKTFFFKGWQFDWLYDKLWVQPAVKLAQWNKSDFIDKIYTWIAELSLYLNKQVVKTQNGQLRWYVMGVTFGVVVVIAIIILV